MFRLLCVSCLLFQSGERIFSKLKLIKTFLQSSMNEDRLNSLALLSIKNAVASELDYSRWQFNYKMCSNESS